MEAQEVKNISDAGGNEGGSGDLLTEKKPVSTSVEDPSSIGRVVTESWAPEGSYVPPSRRGNPFLCAPIGGHSRIENQVLGAPFVPPSRSENRVLGGSFLPPIMRGNRKQYREAFADSSETSDEDKPESTIDHFRGKAKSKKKKPNKACSLRLSRITKVPGKGMNSFGFYNYTHKGELVTPIIPAHKEFTRDTGILALDCEMVGVGPKRKDALGRISIVNEFGYCLYDKFVKPSPVVTEYRTPYSGIRKKDLKNATPYNLVKNEVLDIIDGEDHILVGHSLEYDFGVLKFTHPKKLTRDTADYFGKVLNCGKWTPSLKLLTRKILGVEIQEGEHSSITDAQAAMALYRVRQTDWEKSVRRQHNGADILQRTLDRFEDLNVTS